jgi:alpha-acetolactate decarboxylase
MYKSMRIRKIEFLKSKNQSIKIKIMNKKSIIIALFILLPFFSQAQTLFDKYDGQDNVTSIIVNKKMFDLMSKVKMEASDKDAQKYLALIKKLDNLKVFMTSSAKITGDMKVNVEKYLKTSNLDELMRVNDNGKNVKIYVKSGSSDSQVKELLMFIESTNVKGNETVLMSLTGDFDINEISTLTNKMNIPGGDVLKKAGKK